MNIYKRHRLPPGITSYAVWLYYRFNLGHRDVEELLAGRAINRDYRCLGQWPCQKSCRNNQ